MRTSLSVFNYENKKIGDLYDSEIMADGQAHDIVLTAEQNGWKEQSFDLPFMLNLDAEKKWKKARNFRWNYIRNEYLLRLRVHGKKTYEDWFIIHAPKKTVNQRAVTTTVQCSHISSILKTKNLYMSFDDTNGIGTLPYLMEQALKNTGWSIGDCDIFYERDGKTEKKRSLSSDGKIGSYQLVTNICSLFNAYPTYHGDTKKIDFHALSNKGAQNELYVGKNQTALSVEHNSEDIITRLYVEGEYGDNGYVGIDDVNPTGLTYLMNFDYYKSVGLFTDTHQVIYDTYLRDVTAAIAEIKRIQKEVTTKANELNGLWGQSDYMFYLLTDGEITEEIVGGEVSPEKRKIQPGDEVALVKANGYYKYVKADDEGKIFFSPDDVYAVKFLTKASGQIGAREVSIEAKEKLIKNLERKLAVTVDEEKKQEIRNQIADLEKQIQDIYNGTPEAEGLYSLMKRACALVLVIKDLRNAQDNAVVKQENAEADFSIGMGDLLKDGYWSNSNYTVGQEEFLYADAVDMINQISKPGVEYTVSYAALSEAMNIEQRDLELNAKARLYDPSIEVNDIVYVTKIVKYLDDPQKDRVEISNDDITLTGKTFESIMGRVTQIADLIEQKNNLYERSKIISGDGSIQMDKLNGSIDIQKNRLLSANSSWYTDDNGNIVFESVNGKSAMMLCGDGFMIAYGKTDEGDWNWRTKHHWFSPQRYGNNKID